MRYFKMTQKYIGGSMVERRCMDYRWTKGRGLQCQIDGAWIKSEYTLREFLARMNGDFVEVR